MKSRSKFRVLLDERTSAWLSAVHDRSFGFRIAVAVFFCLVLCSDSVPDAEGVCFARAAADKHTLLLKHNGITATQEDDKHDIDIEKVQFSPVTLFIFNETSVIWREVMPGYVHVVTKRRSKAQKNRSPKETEIKGVDTKEPVRPERRVTLSKVQFWSRNETVVSGSQSLELPSLRVEHAITAVLEAFPLDASEKVLAYRIPVPHVLDIGEDAQATSPLIGLKFESEAERDRFHSALLDRQYMLHTELGPGAVIEVEVAREEDWSEGWENGRMAIQFGEAREIEQAALLQSAAEEVGALVQESLQEKLAQPAAGPGVESGGAGRGGGKFYLTTAIAYTNAPPHIGHAYEAVAADVLARHHRSLGKEIFFLTGSDEHGQKIAAAAEKAGVTPEQHCRRLVEVFQALYSKLDVRYDRYIRTTSEGHMEVAKLVFNRAMAAGDVYLDTYKGWYNEREEAFVTDGDAQLSNFSDAVTGLPLKRVEEPSYFFRLSRYQQRLTEHIERHPDWIQPATIRKEILDRLQEPLRDLSISRTTFTWGVPVPSDPEHVMYVWFDALSNYLSGVGWPSGEQAHMWPCDLHLVGKDIMWFHTVIWPCMLFSAGVPLPAQVYGHGFVNDRHGRKMSKSLANVEDPFALLESYQSDTIRFFLTTAIPFGSELPFSHEAMVLAHNGQLADGLGNLVKRATALCLKYCEGRVPADPPAEPPFALRELIAETCEAFEAVALQRAAEAALRALRSTNKWLYEQQPWKLPDDERAKRAGIVRTCLESVYILAHLFLPFVPAGSSSILRQLGDLPPKTLGQLCASDNLPAGTAIDNSAGVLYSKLSVPVEPKAPPAAFPLDVRVGKVLGAEEIQDGGAAGRVLLRVDVGRSDAVTVVASIPDIASSTPGGASSLVGRRPCLLLNLEPATISEHRSEGMLLVAELLKPKPQQQTQRRQVLVESDAEVGSVVAPRGGLVRIDGVATRKTVQKLKLKVGERGEVNSGEHPLFAAGVAVVAAGAGKGYVVH